MNDVSQDDLTDGSLLAAVDLGSNSFHLIIARIEQGEIRPTQALSEKIQLAAGLDSERRLSPDAIERGLECLGRFAQLLKSVEPERLRVVGTSALRRARNRRDFTDPARKILAAPVEVIYGREEARLVYLGVAHTLADDAQARLVVDIGGGSTEFAIGERFEPRQLESLKVGCVTYSREYFPDGKLSKRNYRRAYDSACVEISHIRRDFRRKHWVEAVGSSGTLQAIEGILGAQDWGDGSITRKGLQRMRRELLRYDRFEDIELSGLSAARRSVIAAGVAITEAIFDVLDIETMRSSRGALREGVVYDLVGRLEHEDVRERSIRALMQRYHVDEPTAERVARRARTFFDAVSQAWGLGETDGELLERAALSHEIGKAISHKHFHRHGAYLLSNSDLAGFSQQDQEDMATMVAGQQGKLQSEQFSDGDDEGRRLQRLTALLRLAVSFKYVEELEALPDLSIAARDKGLQIHLPKEWLQRHPLTKQELKQQKAALRPLGLRLEIGLSRSA